MTSFSKSSRPTATASYLRIETTKSYTNRDYCVQYRETDLAFLSRLMEDEGIYYYFEHNQRQHMSWFSPMHLPRTRPCPTASTFKILAVTGLEATEDIDLELAARRTHASRQMDLARFPPRGARQFVEATDPSTAVAAEGKKFEVYDCPARTPRFSTKSAHSAVVRPKAINLSASRMEKARDVINNRASALPKAAPSPAATKSTLRVDRFRRLISANVITHAAYQSPSYQNLTAARAGLQQHLHARFDCIPHLCALASRRAARYSGSPIRLRH